MEATYQKTGEYHLKNGLDNQDAVYEAESKTAKIVVIADGVSACCNGKQGAEISCRAVGDIMLNETEYMFSASKEKIAGLLSSYVYKQLSIIAKKDNQPVSSYASTLSFVCCNKINGKVMTFVLGDSLIYRISDGNILLACKPNLSDNSEIYTTTTRNVAEAIEINISASPESGQYLLATDGAWTTFYSDGVLSYELEQAVTEGKIIDYLEKQQCTDDCSIVMIAVSKGT